MKKFFSMLLAAFLLLGTLPALTLYAAVQTAEGLMQIGNEAQADINAAAEAFQQAMAALQPREPEPAVNKQGLLNLLAEAESYLALTGRYTAESLTALQAQVDEAWQVVDNTVETQQDVNTAMESMQAAMAGLVKQEKPSPGDEDGDVEYKLLGGANGEYTGSTNGPVFHSEGELASLQRVTVDGKALTLGTHYTLAEGSTVVTLLALTALGECWFGVEKRVDNNRFA